MRPMFKSKSKYLTLILPAVLAVSTVSGCDLYAGYELEADYLGSQTDAAADDPGYDADDFALEIEADTSLLNECEFGRVVDGDTIICYDKDGNKLRVRLTGINAPESVHPDEEMNTEEGRQASEFLKGLLEDTEYVYLEYDVEQFDQYDRTLAYVWIEEDGEYLMLNEIMLSEGYAEPVFIKPNLKYADYFDDYKEE